MKTNPSKQKHIQESDAPNCDTYLVDLGNVRQVQPEILPIHEAQRMAEFFGSMSLLQFTDFALIPSPSPQGEGSKIQSPSP